MSLETFPLGESIRALPLPLGCHRRTQTTTMTRMRKTKSMTTRKTKNLRSSENWTNADTKDGTVWLLEITSQSDLIAAQSISLSEPRLDGEQVYWLEGRPQELGRYVVVRASSLGGRGTDVTPRPYNARTRVH